MKSESIKITNSEEIEKDIYLHNNCSMYSNVSPPTSTQSWQQPASDWRTLSKMPDVSRTVAAESESREIKSLSESIRIS